MKTCSIPGCEKKHHSHGYCGAHRQQIARMKNISDVASSEYNAWRAMLARCRNPANNRFHLYGFRGISVCERWTKYSNFLADMGRKPTPQHTLERTNNDKGYYPENCRWATRTEQARNKRTSRVVYLHNEWMPLIVAASKLKISYGAAYKRLAKGKLA